MDEKIYTLVSSGLLAVVVLLLLLILGRLARLERVLGPRAAAETATSSTEAERSVAPEQEVEAEREPEAQQIQADEDGPFERDGRWWFRRAGQLLVYDEQNEAWVDPKPHVLDEAKGWDSAAAIAATAAPIPEPVSPPEPIAVTEPPAELEPSPEPMPVAEQTFEQPDPVTATTPATPEPEDSSQPEPVAETSTPPEAATEPGQATHWKCPACGVINGSTATSCRMCFAARP